MQRVVFDIETNGLLDKCDKLFSLVLQDLDTGEVLSCADQEGYAPLSQGLDILIEASTIIGHNIVQFDIPALKRIYPGFQPKGTPYDTLLAARVAYPDVMMFDESERRIPSKYWGAHSLKAWGYRVGVHKTHYEHGFDEWSKIMQDYCEDDVAATVALYEFLQEEQLSPEALRIEHKLAEYLFAQEQGGFPFDVDKALALKERLERDLQEALVELQNKYFRRWVVPGEMKVPTRNWGRLKEILGPKAEVFKKAKGAAYQEIVIKEFTGGPQQIKQCLKRFYGWKPEFIKKRKKVEGEWQYVFEEEGTDSDVLSKLSYDCIPALLKYNQAKKVLGMLSEGQNAWLKLVAADGRIHGRVNQNGTVTHRARHSRPNMSQVPSVNKPYGQECRELFYAPDGWVLMGSDASGLELRMLAHYMHQYDKGAYAFEILNGDIHTANQQAANLSTRAQAKTFIYGFLYGAGAAKIGSIVSPEGHEIEQQEIGRELKRRFLSSLPALDRVIKDTSAIAKRLGYVYSLDGRKTYVKSDHKALNCLLQSSGSILVKKWITLFYEEMLEKFGGPGWEGNWTPCSYSHDDVILAVRADYVQQVEEVLMSNIKKAGEIMEMNIRIDGDVMTGRTWKEVH